MAQWVERLKQIAQQTIERLPKDIDSIPALLQYGAGIIQRQKIDRFVTLGTIVTSTFFLADVTAFLAQDYFLKEALPGRSGGYSGGMERSQSFEDFGVIFSRNLFNSRGLIPGENNGKAGEGPAVRTTLPLNLIGTVILQDELRSLATLEDKSSSLVYPVRFDDEIPTKIKITKVEARKVTFVNLSNGRNEFVDMPEELFTVNPIVTVKSSVKRGGIEQVSEGKYSVARREIDAALADLPTILTQARAVPNWENGVFTCYKLFQIVPNSIYDKLGLKNGDCLAEIDNEAILDPGKAFEKLQALKDKNHVDLKIKRNGKDQGLSYDIN